MNEVLEIFLEKIKDTFGDKLDSVILYGSKAKDESGSSKGDHNILILLKELDFTRIKALSGFMPKWIKSGNKMPVIFTKDRFLCSSDVFPVEFLEIKENRKVLIGKDPMEGLSISLDNLKHQCEFELRSKTLKLIESYLLYYSNPSKVRDILKASISSVTAVLRNSIRLFGQEPPAERGKVIEKIGELAGADTSVFAKVLELKNGTAKVSSSDTGALMEEYIARIEAVTDKIDKIKS